MKKIYIFAGIAAVLAGVLLYFYLGKLEENSKVKIEYEPVLVAAEDIQPYTAITEDMVAVTQVPKGSRHAKAASEKVQVLGLMTGSVILAGEQMIPEKLIATGEEATTLSYAIPEGMRAVTIAVNDISGVAGLIRKGDYVDVIAYLPIYDAEDRLADGALPQKDGPTEEETTKEKEAYYYDVNSYTTTICVQDVQVVAIGKDLTGTGTETTSSTYEFITLLVTPDQALRIAEGEHSGLLTVLLRATGDHEFNDSVPINRFDLLQLTE